MDHDDVATSTDIDALWGALRQAKADGDHDLARSIEGRMRQLTEERRFAHLSDDELQQRITALQGNRAPTGMLSHSPQGMGDLAEGPAMMAHNAGIRANQADVGVETTLAALQAEHERRRGTSPGTSA